MADIQWPPGLPQAFERPDYGEAPPDLAVRTQMDAGPDKVRLGATTGYRAFKGKLVLSSTELATFKTFYKTTTRGGSRAFDFLHPRTGATIEVCFADEPQIGAAGGDYWFVNFSLEHMDPVPEEPAASIFLMEGLGFGDVSDFLMGGLG